MPDIQLLPLSNAFVSSCRVDTTRFGIGLHAVHDAIQAWDEAEVQRQVLPNYLQSVMSAVESQHHLAKYARAGAFNDPDMLVVGLTGMTPYGIVNACPPHIPDCTVGEYISRERWGLVGGLTPDEQRCDYQCFLFSRIIG